MLKILFLNYSFCFKLHAPIDSNSVHVCVKTEHMLPFRNFELTMIFAFFCVCFSNVLRVINRVLFDFIVSIFDIQCRLVVSLPLCPIWLHSSWCSIQCHLTDQRKRKVIVMYLNTNVRFVCHASKFTWFSERLVHCSLDIRIAVGVDFLEQTVQCITFALWKIWTLNSHAMPWISHFEMNISHLF